MRRYFSRLFAFLFQLSKPNAGGVERWWNRTQGRRRCGVARVMRAKCWIADRCARHLLCFIF